MLSADEMIKVCDLLSNMYLCKPDREAMKMWRTLLLQDIPDIMLDLRNAVCKVDMTSDKEFEDLLWEYTRLFIGPYKLPCPPWESVYTSPKRLMMQESYDQVRAYYGKADLTISDQEIMADHIGAEFNFLSVLLRKANSEAEKQLYYRDLASGFVAGHIMKWVPQFAHDLEEAAELHLYKALARTTSQFISLQHL